MFGIFSIEAYILLEQMTTDSRGTVIHSFKTYTSSPDHPADLYHLGITCTLLPAVISSLTFTTEQVRMQVQRLCAGKDADPDGIEPQVLKACAPEWST